MATTRLLSVLFILGVLVLLSRALDPCSHDQINGTRIDVKCFHEMSKCVNLRDNFKKIYNVLDLPVVSPKILKTNSFCEPDANGINQSGIHLEWTLRGFSGVELTKGFEIKFHAQLRDSRCFIITLLDNITTEMIRKSPPIFTATLYPISRRAEIVHFSLDSLPSSENATENQYFSIKPEVCKRPPSSSEWCPSTANFTSSYDAFNKTLKISFDPPPAHFNISQYELYEEVLDKTSSLINETEHTYNAVEPGNYAFIILPYESYPNDQDRCVCRNDMDLCAQCRMCKQNYIDVVTSPPITSEPKPEATDEGGNKQTMTLSVSFASVFFVLLSISAVLFRRRIGKCLGCSGFHLKKKSGFQRKMFVFVQTHSNMVNTQKAKDLMESQFGPMCEYHKVSLDDKVKDSILTILQCSNVSKQSNTILEGCQANTDSVVCVCLALGDREPTDNLNIFQETLRTLQYTRGTKAKTHGLVIHWDSPPIIVRKDLVCCFKLPDEHTQLLAEVRSFMTTSCQRYIPKSECLDKEIDSTTSRMIPQYSEYNGMTVNTKQKKCRYPSNNDSGLGVSLPTPSYLQGMTFFTDCFERDGRYLDQQDSYFGQTYDRNLGHSCNRNMGCSYDRDMGHSCASHEEHPPVCRHYASGLEYVGNPSEYDHSRQQRYMNYETDGDNLDFVTSKDECNISFIPPTPSLLSMEMQDSKIENPDSQSNCEGEKADGGESGENTNMEKSNSIDTLMDEFWALNDRNGALKVGEVYSVFEGCV